MAAVRQHQRTAGIALPAVQQKCQVPEKDVVAPFQPDNGIMQGIGGQCHRRSIPISGSDHQTVRSMNPPERIQREPDRMAAAVKQKLRGAGKPATPQRRQRILNVGEIPIRTYSISAMQHVRTYFQLKKQRVG